MLCLIADLVTYVPSIDTLDHIYKDYLISDDNLKRDIVIDDKLYRYSRYHNLNNIDIAYLESGYQFYLKLLDFNGLMLHASAVVLDNKTYLFVGQSGIGKSTHAKLLKKYYKDALLINDDKPAIRYIDNMWYAYGTPFSGKDNININAKYPLKAICLLSKRRDRNNIRELDSISAFLKLLVSTVGRTSKESLDKLSILLNRLIKDIRIYEMDSLADEKGIKEVYEIMKK